jgi:hypothetical protein
VIRHHSAVDERKHPVFGGLGSADESRQPGKHSPQLGDALVEEPPILFSCLPLVQETLRANAGVDPLVNLGQFVLNLKLGEPVEVQNVRLLKAGSEGVPSHVSPDVSGAKATGNQTKRLGFVLSHLEVLASKDDSVVAEV